MMLEKAALYEQPFEHLKREVYPVRSKNRRAAYAARWWQYAEPRPGMREALVGLHRFVATPCHSKYRVFVFLDSEVSCQPSKYRICSGRRLILGILQSRLHEKWALTLGTRLETRPRYTTNSCFETFPLPECVWAGEGGTSLSLGEGRVSPDSHALRSSGTCHPTSQAAAIAAAAKELDELRNNWLNPPEWTKTEVLEFPGSVDGPWARYIDPATVRADPDRSRHTPCAGSRTRRVRTTLPVGEGTTSNRTVRWPRARRRKIADLAAEP